MSTKNILLDPEAVKKNLIPQLNEALTEAAEPILKEALEEIEKVLRQKIASIVIGMLDHNFNVQAFQDEIRIAVFHKSIP